MRSPPSPLAFMIRRTALLLLLSLGLSACDSRDANGVGLSSYENSATEALLREMVSKLPDPSPGVPKSYAITLGEIVGGRDYTAATQEFQRRFEDTKLRFLSADVLSVADPDNTIVDPRDRVAVYILQVRTMRLTSPTTYEYEANWSYKKFYQRKTWRVTEKDGKYFAEETATLDGNWPPK